MFISVHLWPKFHNLHVSALALSTKQLGFDSIADVRQLLLASNDPRLLVFGFLVIKCINQCSIISIEEEPTNGIRPNPRH